MPSQHNAGPGADPAPGRGYLSEMFCSIQGEWRFVGMPMASILLPWRAGGAVALDLCVSGRSVTAEQAEAMGVINAVTDDPEGWWRALVSERLQPCSASSLRFAERAVRSRLMRDIDTALEDLERLYVDDLMKTHDANEGIAAFLERRSPQFTHR